MIMNFVLLFCILITIGLMIAIKKNRHIENDFVQHDTKNLDSLWLNFVLFGITIYSIVLGNYFKG